MFVLALKFCSYVVFIIRPFQFLALLNRREIQITKQSAREQGFQGGNRQAGGSRLSLALEVWKVGASAVWRLLGTAVGMEGKNQDQPLGPGPHCLQPVGSHWQCWLVAQLKNH